MKNVTLTVLVMALFAPLRHQSQTGPVILISEKCLLPPAFTLCHMMRNPRRHCSRHSCHAHMKSDHMAFVNNQVRCPQKRTVNENAIAC
jgi:hypothetical protein